MKKRILSYLLVIAIITACFMVGSIGSNVSAATQNIFTTQTPSTYSNDAQYELGTKFKANINGTITKVRIYTNATEAGVHTVRIWKADGTLQSGPYTWSITSGTAGWKIYTLPTSLNISANVDYIVAVSTSTDKYYANTAHGFDSPINNGNLITYTGSGLFGTSLGSMPNSSYNNTNYFRDIEFSTGSTPTPTPTPTPGGATPTPTPSGSWPDASNTGVPAGTTLTSASGSTISVDGTIYECKNVTGQITVSANNVTIRKCKITTGGYYGILHSSGTGLVIEDCEITSNGTYYDGIGGGNMRVSRCNIYNFENGLGIGSGTTVEDCYIHDLHYATGFHVDGIEWGGTGDNCMINHNNIRLGGDTGCVNVTPFGGGTANNNTIQNNLFYGGTYSLYLRGDGGGSVSGVTVTGNVWVKNSYVYGTHSIVSVSGITWSNNKLDDGTIVNQ